MGKEVYEVEGYIGRLVRVDGDSIRVRGVGGERCFCFLLEFFGIWVLCLFF